MTVPTTTSEPEATVGQVSVESPGAPRWPAQVAATLDSMIAGVADKTVRPLTFAARIAVFAAVVLAMAQVATVLGAIALLRLLDVYAFPGRVWASYAVIGGIFTLAGWFLWTRRRPGK